VPCSKFETLLSCISLVSADVWGNMEEHFFFSWNLEREGRFDDGRTKVFKNSIVKKTGVHPCYMLNYTERICLRVVCAGTRLSALYFWEKGDQRVEIYHDLLIKTIGEIYFEYE
jgi:hypothetical protein